MKRANRLRLLMSAIILLVLVAWVAAASVQRQGGAATQGGASAPAAQATAPPIRIMVTVTQVKPDMIGVYDDLIKNEANPALKKAGIPYRWMFTNFISGQNFLRVSVQPITNMAQFDQPAPLLTALGAGGAANYNGKLRATVVTSETRILTLQRNMSIITNALTPPVFVQVQTIQLAPGKAQEFANIMTADFLPNYKKVGVTEYRVYTTTFGGPQGQLTLVRPFTKFAEIDKGPLLTQAVGAEAAAQINARRNALTMSSEIIFERYLPELSFGVPARPTN